VDAISSVQATVTVAGATGESTTVGVQIVAMQSGNAFGGFTVTSQVTSATASPIDVSEPALQAAAAGLVTAGA
jgi:hypothetical protein